MYILFFSLCLFFFFFFPSKEIKSEPQQERVEPLSRPPQCLECTDPATAQGAAVLRQHTPLLLSASLAAHQPPRASGFDVRSRLSSGQAVVALAWASLTRMPGGMSCLTVYISIAKVLVGGF